jgi:hypothetical protein
MLNPRDFQSVGYLGIGDFCPFGSDPCSGGRRFQNDAPGPFDEAAGAIQKGRTEVTSAAASGSPRT